MKHASSVKLKKLKSKSYVSNELILVLSQVLNIEYDFNMGNISEKASSCTIAIPFKARAHDVTAADVVFARHTWRCIIGNETRAYLARRNHPDFHASSCIAWFYDWWDNMFA